MKIALFHELHDGGARRAVNEIAKNLKLHHQVDLYVVEKEENKEEKDYFSTIFFNKFISKNWKGGNWRLKLYKDTVELYRLYKLHKKIAKDIDTRNYDVVFIHPSQFTQAPFLLRFLKTKKIYYCQEPLRMVYEPGFEVASDTSLPKKIYEKIIRWLRKKIDNVNINHADVILANSKYTKDNILRAYGLKSRTCYLGVDTDIFKPISIRKDKDILFIGEMEEKDGFFLLKKAINCMKKKPKLRVHLSGKDWINNDRKFMKLYVSTKVVVCLAQNEPFGLIPVEAMACGVPVVAINEGGYKETVKDGITGFLVQRHPQAIAEKIDYLLKNPKKARMMSKKAREYIVTYWNWDKQIKEFVKMLA